MKRFIIALLLMILCIFSLLGCNNKTVQTEELKEEVKEEPVEEKLSFEVDKTAMLNSMQADECFIVQNGWFYGLYTAPGKWGFAMFRTDDQNDVTWIAEESIPEGFIFHNEYLYFTLRENRTDKGHIGEGVVELYRCRLGGSEPEKLQGKYIHDFRIYNNKIYFTQGKMSREDENAKNKLYKCTLNGKKKRTVLKKNVSIPYFVDDYLFYQNEEDKDRLHMYNMIDKEDKRITKRYCGGHYMIDGEDIYFTGAKKKKHDKNGYEMTHLIKHNINTEEEEIVHKNVRAFNYYEDRILFTNLKDNYKLYSMDKSGNDIQLVVNEENINNISFYDDHLYVLTYIGDRESQTYDKLYRCKTNGKKKKEIVNYRNW